jgi:hypothetical protein
MQEQLAGTPPIGAIRELTCVWCSKPGQRIRRMHVYGECRTWRQFERYWECTSCGQQRPYRAEIQQPQTDPETERLHAQWREDNEKSLLTSRQLIR